MRLSPEQDAYGRELLAHLEGEPVQEIVERDDGLITGGGGTPAYFAAYRSWPSDERRAMRYVRGRVLDVGAGAGRVALHLQERGHEVVAIDNSPLALEVCRRRGVKDARHVSVTEVDSSLGLFDTIVMFGNNFGLVGGERRARWLLRRFRALTTDRGRIVAESRDPYATDKDFHARYRERNRRRGRMAGQLRIRIRYLDTATPWFDYLIVSPEEMERLVAGTGWRIRRFIDGAYGMYTAVIERA